MMAVIAGCINLLAMFTLTSQPAEYSRLSEHVHDHVQEAEMTNMAAVHAQNDATCPEYIADLKGFSIFKNLDYHLIVWPFVTCAAIELLFIYNVTTFLRSFRLENYDVLLTVLGPIIGSVSKLYNGFVSDWTMQRVPRGTYLLLANGLQSLALLLLLVAGDNMGVMVIATILVYNANGANMSLVPSIIGESPSRIYSIYFPRNSKRSTIRRNFFISTQNAFGQENWPA